MLNFKEEIEYYYQPTQFLFNDFLVKSGVVDEIIEINSTCVSSLTLESNFLSWFKKKEISVTNMG
jgi:hypothetical protein